jgi:hypothetical protein
MPYSALSPVNGPETPKIMGPLEDDDDDDWNRLPQPSRIRLPVRAAALIRNFRRVVIMTS